MKELFISQRKNTILWSIITLLLASCERVALDNDDETDDKRTVTVSVMQVENIPWQETRTAGDLCTRLSIAFFDYTTGEKLVQMDQLKNVDEDFGTFEVQLKPQKAYRMVVIGYTAPEFALLNAYDDVQFVNNAITADVFSYCYAFNVGAYDSELAVTLKRVSALIALDITGDIPKEALYFRFRIVGASRNLNPTTGLGNSIRKFLEVKKTFEKGVTFYSTNVFAMENPHKLDTLQITAYNNKDEVIRSIKYINEVSIAPNRQTVIKGDFFKTKINPSVTIDEEWDSTIEYDIPDEDESGQP